MTKRRMRSGILTVVLAIGLFAAATRAQENVEEDVAAVKLCSEALKIVIGWGAGKVLDHYAAAALEARTKALLISCVPCIKYLRFPFCH